MIDRPANQIDWTKIKHFSPKEHWGDLSKVSGNLVVELDKLRDKIGVPFLLSPRCDGAAYATYGHSKESWHYVIPGRNSLALAVDFFPTDKFIETIKTAFKETNFTAIGAYPFASYYTSKYGIVHGMLHLDMRPIPTKLLWYRDKNDNYHYFLQNQFEPFLKIVKRLYNH